MKNEEVYIKARSDSKIYHANPGNLELEMMDQVLFDTEQCQEIGRVVPQSFVTEETAVESDVSKITIIRRLNDKDHQLDEKQKQEATQNLVRCREIITKYSLPMELLDADLSFDGKKLTFYFSAPGRVDFRSLVSELASTFQKLIRLQQVGARDRARCIGGLGRCGEEFCCKRFLKGDLECVTLDMAYTQNLAQMGSNRITGACGKLMCCLKYEMEVYKDCAKCKKDKNGEKCCNEKTPKAQAVPATTEIKKAKAINNDKNKK
ncbi:MAG: regulatory iron-sulfur-containing complex subunit RicT [bacterium]